jgi:hypothetical protein
VHLVRCVWSGLVEESVCSDATRGTGCEWPVVHSGSSAVVGDADAYVRSPLCGTPLEPCPCNGVDEDDVP